MIIIINKVAKIMSSVDILDISLVVWSHPIWQQFFTALGEIVT